MGKERKKKQHYVPIFYLKNFSIVKNGEYYIYCFEKASSKKFKVNIKEIACENYFYEISENVPQELEDAISAHEY